MSNQYGPRIITNGLVLCLDAANRTSYPGGGTIWNDLSGYNNTGVLTNGPTFSSSNGGNIVFDGINDYISIPSNNSLNVSSKNFSIDIWIRIGALLETDNTYLSIFQKGRVGNSTFQYSINIAKVASNNYNNHIVCGLSQPSLGNINTIYSTGFNNIILNQWYNFIFVKNSSVLFFYLNGNFFSSASTISSVNDSNDPLVIGANSAAAQAINCRVSNTRFYIDKALSSAEVAQNYNTTKGRFGL
jgi:hypothetical protein